MVVVVEVTRLFVISGDVCKFIGPINLGIPFEFMSIWDFNPGSFPDPCFCIWFCMVPGGSFVWFGILFKFKFMFNFSSRSSLSSSLSWSSFLSKHLFPILKYRQQTNEFCFANLVFSLKNQKINRFFLFVLLLLCFFSCSNLSM